MLDHVHIRVLTYQLVKLVPPGWKMPAFQSSFWRFYCNDHVGATIEHAGKSYELEQGRAYFIPAGVRFSTNLTQSVGHLFVHFDLLGLPYHVQQENFSQPVQLPSQPAFDEAVCMLRQEMELGEIDLLMQLRIKAILYEALTLYLHSLSPKQLQQSLHRTEGMAALIPALQFIDANLADGLLNSDLADLCHMNTDYFIRRFRLSLGRTPVQYIQEQRVKRAEQQLLLTDLSLEQIATENGFGSRAYFTRIFTRHSGVSPAAFRKGLRIY
jgi:AraC-like DNA-binding protein